MGPRGAPPGWTRGAAAAVACLASRRAHVARRRATPSRPAGKHALANLGTLVITHVDVISMPLAARIGGVRRWRGEESDASCTEVVCKSPVAPVLGNSLVFAVLQACDECIDPRARIAPARSPLVPRRLTPASSSHAPSPPRARRTRLVMSRGGASCDTARCAGCPTRDPPMHRGSRPSSLTSSRGSS